MESGALPGLEEGALPGLLIEPDEEELQQQLQDSDTVRRATDVQNVREFPHRGLEGWSEGFAWEMGGQKHDSTHFSC